MKSKAITRIELPFQPPFDWPFFLRYLSGRATAGVESIENDTYHRAIEIDGRAGLISVSHDAADHLQLEMIGDVADRTDTIVPRVRRIFDLDANLALVHQTLGRSQPLVDLLGTFPGVRIPGAWCSFELLVRTIVGQQVTVKAATTIMSRLVTRFGRTANVDGRNVSFFPTPRALADADMQGIGMPGKRVQALQGVARAIADNAIPALDPGGNHTEIKSALLELPGIGPWTVEYFAMRALRDQNAWPGSDLVLKRVAAQHDATAWQPYRGYAAMHFWNQASQSTT